MKVCVVGPERSGTSAAAYLLSAASGWSLLDDPPAAWYSYMLVAHTGHGFPPRLWATLLRYDIVKVPGFAAILRYLKPRFLGRFAVVYCLRDPRDVVASVRERCKSAGYSGIFSDVTWLTHRLPRTVLVRDDVDALAWRWRIYLEEARAFEQGGGRIYYLRYEDFLKDRASELRRCAASLGIPFDAARLEGLLDRQFKKSWSPKIRGAGRFDNDLTEDECRRIEEICGSHFDFGNRV